ncbi:hypothetical protein [Haladaptatus sp. W1]|uniref:hypothetical protein n=1 Tax=Haladaptatus sp. W1 TaxID=1897478 RepID=UPI0015862A8D|nr:hypothetical protein [Haladaptatus sp. W1]
MYLNGGGTDYQITLISRIRCLSLQKDFHSGDHIIETMDEYVERRFETNRCGVRGDADGVAAEIG